MVNDGTLNSPSNSAAYYQFSNAILRSELNYKGSKLYAFNQINSSENPILISVSFLQFKDIYGLQIKASKITNATLSKVSYSTTHLYK
jgi:hypothetical protein